nr:MAG TPA: hypothetical protein [Bacteriophage sp.]
MGFSQPSFYFLLHKRELLAGHGRLSFALYIYFLPKKGLTRTLMRVYNTCAIKKRRPRRKRKFMNTKQINTRIAYYDALRKLMANAKENMRQAEINLDDALTDGTAAAEEKDLAQARYDAAVNLYARLINLPFEYEEEDDF